MSNKKMKRAIWLFSVGYGTVAAMIISWDIYRDILWMLLHGVCGWFYVFAVLLGIV